MERQLSSSACHRSSTLELQRQRSHSVSELDCVGNCTQTTRLSYSLSDNSPPDVATISSNTSKTDDALQIDCDVNSVTPLCQHV